MDSTTASNDTLLQLLTWLEKNKQKVALIAGGVVVLTGIIAAVIYYQGQKEVRASEALSEVRTSVNPTAPAPAGALEAYLRVAQEYEGTKAAGRALLEAAAVLYHQGDYAKAESRYKQFLSEYPESSFQPQGMLGLASTLDAAGKSSDATSKYEEILRRFPNDSVADEAKLSLARLQEKVNPAEAYKRYNELVGLGSQSGIAQEAGIRREDLVEKHPDLLKTNTPTTSPVATLSSPSPQITMIKPGATNQAAVTSANPPSITITTSAPVKTTSGTTPSPTANTPLLVSPAPSKP